MDPIILAIFAITFILNNLFWAGVVYMLLPRDMKKPIRIKMPLINRVEKPSPLDWDPKNLAELQDVDPAMVLKSELSNGMET